MVSRKLRNRTLGRMCGYTSTKGRWGDMAFWIRDATLVIGNNKYSLAGLDFSFEIPFEDSDEPPVATVKVTNLAPHTRANIKRNDPVILNAGYEGDVGCILIGKAVGLKHKQSNVDWTSTLTVQPCADEILGKLINKTYTENILASAMVRDLLNIFGVEVAKCELTLDQSYPRGRVCHGNLKQVLTEIVVNECKSRFIIRPTGQIYITKADGGINTGVTLTPATGLLRSDEEKVAIPLETDLNSQKTGEDREEDTISRSCLLNYRIATAEIVKVQSADLNGQFLVVKGKHSGGRTGDWKTSMELKPYSPPVSAAGAAAAASAGTTAYGLNDTV
ncbi:phage protein, partial [Parabacteroides goldsteinii]|uniref:phage protein n=1 Tax=Parabacteroides goldsteinii TaxID=328812 RepID=UPI002601EEBB